MELESPIPYDSYDTFRAQIKASILWLMSKAYRYGHSPLDSNHIPVSLLEPFHDYANHDEQSIDYQFKPTIIRKLTSGEYYCLCLSHIYSDPDYIRLTHSDVIEILVSKGIFREQLDAILSEPVLSQSKPFHLDAHMAIIAGLMRLYIEEVLKPTKVAQVCNEFIPVSIDEVPENSEDAAIFWINKSCQRKKQEILLEKRTLDDDLANYEDQHSVDSSQHSNGENDLMPLVPLEDLNDISDGCSLATLISLYCPNDFSWQEIVYNNQDSINDSIYNLKRIQQFCYTMMPYNICFLSVEDLLYVESNIRINVLAFIADLMFEFVIQPCDLVIKPEQIYVINNNKIIKKSPKRTGKTRSDEADESIEPIETGSEAYEGDVEPSEGLEVDIQVDGRSEKTQKSPSTLELATGDREESLERTFGSTILNLEPKQDSFHSFEIEIEPRKKKSPIKTEATFEPIQTSSEAFEVNVQPSEILPIDQKVNGETKNTRKSSAFLELAPDHEEKPFNPTFDDTNVDREPKKDFFNNTEVGIQSSKKITPTNTDRSTEPICLGSEAFEVDVEPGEDQMRHVSNVSGEQMAKKKEAIMLLTLRRRAEQEAKRVAKANELARQREEAALQRERSEQRKQEYKQRREMILDQYRQKKMAAEAEKDNGSSNLKSLSQSTKNIHAGSHNKRNGSCAEISVRAEYSGPKLFSKPTAKTNLTIMQNAIAKALEGAANAKLLKRMQDTIDRSKDCRHFLILFRDRQQFRGLYDYDAKTEKIQKLDGTGPKIINCEEINEYYKFDSPKRQFTKVDTKHLSLIIAAISLHDHLWPKIIHKR